MKAAYQSVYDGVYKLDRAVSGIHSGESFLDVMRHVRQDSTEASVDMVGCPVNQSMYDSVFGGRKDAACVRRTRPAALIVTRAKSILPNVS